MNGDRRPVGKCSCCGGVVSLPVAWWSVNRPVPTCERCGAVADETDPLPVVKTRPVGGVMQARVIRQRAGQN